MAHTMYNDLCQQRLEQSMKKLLLFTAISSIVAISTVSCNESEPHYSITWLDYDNTVLRVDTVFKNKMPTYGEDPTREQDEYYTYEFSGWSPEVVKAVEDATYVATYEPSPITEIDEATFKKAMNLYNKNFTVVIKRDAGYEETITHNEKNEYYGVYTLDGVSSYRAFYNEYDDVVTYFTGEVNNNRIIWTNQISGKVSELTRYAFDQNKYIQSAMAISFDKLTYDNDSKCYKASIDSNNWTFSFSGSRLLSVTTSFYNVATTLTFSNYDDTEVEYDQYLTDYVTNMYPNKETLKSIIDAALINKYPKGPDDAYSGDLEYYLTYYEDDVNMEHYEVHMEQLFWHFMYEGKNKICGVTSGGFIFFPVIYWDYVLESGKTYVYTEDYNSNPFDENSIGTRTHKAIELAEEATSDLDAWENYSVTCGKVTFDLNNKHYTFEISFNDGNDLAWYISGFTVQYKDGEKDIEYNMEYINIDFKNYEDGDIILVDPE